MLNFLLCHNLFIRKVSSVKDKKSHEEQIRQLLGETNIRSVPASPVLDLQFSSNHPASMSHHSGFSSASRMEIDRLNKESEEKDRRAAIAAAEMSAQRAQLTAQNEQMKAMQAILAANGLIPVQNKANVQGTSAQARATDQANAIKSAVGQPQPHPRAHQSHSQAPVATLLTDTPSRKRNLSQQQERAAKIHGGSRGGVARNRFEILTQAESYPDTSMRPGSVLSGPANRAVRTTPSYANKVGQMKATGPATHPQAAVNHTDGPIEDLEIEGIFSINNEGAMRKEIEVHFLTLNGEKFSGTVTRQEAKHIIFKDCLGFGDFTNFGGARVGYKGSPTVTFLLNTAVNVDEFYPMQRFEFHRKSTRQGRSHTDIIGCKIMGLRQVDRPRLNVVPNQGIDDGTRKILIEGCEYRIPKDVLLQYFENYGEIMSDIKEQLFDDGGSEGLNRTGNYTLRIKLVKDIPQLIPIHGKRIKIHYPGVSRLCTKCFGKHQKMACQSRKLSWPEYMNKFMSMNPEIGVDLIERPRPAYNPQPATISPEEVIARTASPITAREEDFFEQVGDASKDESMDSSSSQAGAYVQPNLSNPLGAACTVANPVKPSKVDYLVPKNKIEHNQMIEKLVNAGTQLHEAEQIIAMRKSAFAKANLEFKKNNTKEAGQARRKSNQSMLVSGKKENHGI